MLTTEVKPTSPSSLLTERESEREREDERGVEGRECEGERERERLLETQAQVIVQRRFKNGLTMGHFQQSSFSMAGLLTSREV